MHSSLIGKIEKAHRYAAESDRVAVQDLTMQFRGDHGVYTVSFHDLEWSCTCSFFPQWGVCSHVMAVERLLGPISPRTAGLVSAQPVEGERASAAL
jgi:hypothetical protein